MTKSHHSLTEMRHSLSRRLSWWIVLFAAAIFVAALAYAFVIARKTVRTEAVRGATRELDNTVLRVNGILEDVELAANNLEWLIYRDLDNPEKMMEYSRNVVLNNSFLNGCSISFEPNYYPSKGRYYSAYSNRKDGVVYTQQEGNDQYQYFYLDWYLLPKLLGQPCWTEPYTDQEEEDITMDSRMTVSYCKPLIGNDGAFVGALTLDVSLEWLSQTISAVKPYPHSYSILLGRGGTFLVHPDQEKLFYQTIFTQHLTEEPNAEIWQLGKDMLNWEEGMRVIQLEGKTSFVFFKPMMTTGWSVAIVCQEEDIFGNFHRFQNVVVAIVLEGLLLMFLVFSRLIGKLLDPLRRLASQARVIAGGKFDNKLPEVSRMDEIGVLTRSFGEMQTSLVTYVDELTAATAKRERLEGELQIARKIQMEMVPQTFPSREDVDLYASMTPAKEVGGDLYDFFIQDEKLHFCIGDVSGKGVPASLFMAVAVNLFRLLSKQGLPPAEVARQINDDMAENNEQLMFVTMFMGQLDLKTGRLEFCNCGHNPPVVLAPQPHFMEIKSNTPIGVCAGWEYEGQVLENFRGTPILLYTDGLNEAENAEHEELGNERMLSILAEQPFTGAQALIERLSGAVAAHVAGAPQSDDLTLLSFTLRG